jgi:mono/diheme cytochrome c family protein
MKKCQGCHGPIETSAKRNKTASDILGALNTPPMAHLQLTDFEIAALEIALHDDVRVETKESGKGDTAKPSDGKDLYARYCAACHGEFSVSVKKGITLGRLEAALQKIPEMKHLQILDPADQIEIVSVLAPEEEKVEETGTATATSTTTNPDLDRFLRGKALYTSKCVACHDSFDSSAKRGTTLSIFANALAGKPSMASISLGSAEQSDVVFALNHVASDFDANPPPPTVQYRASYAREMPLQDRVTMTNRLRTIFATDVNGVVSATVNTTIDANITQLPAAMGGPCFQNLDPGCPGPTAFSSITITFQSAEAEILPLPNPQRSALLTKTCLALIESNATAFANALAKAQVTSSDAVTTAGIQRLWTEFYPSVDSDAAVIESLRVSALAAAGTKSEMWKDVLTALCQSSLMERY